MIDQPPCRGVRISTASPSRRTVVVAISLRTKFLVERGRDRLRLIVEFLEQCGERRAPPPQALCRSH